MSGMTQMSLLTFAADVLDSKTTGGHAVSRCYTREVCAGEEGELGELTSQFPDRLRLLVQVGDLVREALQLAIASVRSPYQTERRISLPQAALLQALSVCAAFVDAYVDDEERSADGS